MGKLFEPNQIKTNIKFHHKALEHCADDFPYLPDIKTSLAETYAQLGHKLYKCGQLDEALKNYLRATAYNSYHFQALNQIGLIYEQKNLHQQSLDTFEKIISLATDPRDAIHKADALLSIALVLSKSDIKGATRRAYKSVIEADNLYPNYPLTRKVMRQIRENEKIKTLFADFTSLLNQNKSLEATQIVAQMEELNQQNSQALAARSLLRRHVSANALTSNYSQGFLSGTHSDTSESLTDSSEVELSYNKQ